MTENPWIEWNGGKCPVRLSADVEYRMRGGEPGEISEAQAGALRWEHRGWPGDIIAYRVVSS